MTHLNTNSVQIDFSQCAGTKQQTLSEIGAAIDDLIAEYGDDILNTLGGFYDELVDGASWISDWIRSLLMDVGNGNGGGFQVPQTVDG